MRLAGFLFLIVQILLPFSLVAQPQDTTITITDSTREEVRQTVKKEFGRWRDSVQAERIKKNVQKNGKSLDAFLQEMQESEKARKRQWYIRISVGLAFLIALAIGLARRRRKST